MSFLDELAEPDICEASCCPRCKGDPDAIKLRARLKAEAEARMRAPLRKAIEAMVR